MKSERKIKTYPSFKKGEKYIVWENKNKNKYFLTNDNIEEFEKMERISISISQSLNNIYYDDKTSEVYDSKHFMVPVKNIDYQKIIDFYQSELIRKISKMYQKVFNLGFQHILLKLDPYLDIDNINNPKEYLKNSFDITEEDIEIIKGF